VQALFDGRRHKTIATLRADGSPRISGVQAVSEDGELVFGSMPNARKSADLRRDPRFALHSATIDPVNGSEAQWPGEAKISGRAIAAGPVTEGPDDIETGVFGPLASVISSTSMRPAMTRSSPSSPWRVLARPDLSSTCGSNSPASSEERGWPCGLGRCSFRWQDHGGRSGRFGERPDQLLTHRASSFVCSRGAWLFRASVSNACRRIVSTIAAAGSRRRTSPTLWPAYIASCRTAPSVDRVGIVSL
jgi:Pyridoxamine 5'-phosphate oxidase